MDESISEFEMSGSDMGISSESESAGSAGSVVSSDSDEFSEGSDAEGDISGEDWDELERKAEQHDNKRREREDFGGDVDPRRKKSKGR
jgi:nucleosome binding factor SPN SPT16 subunit